MLKIGSRSCDFYICIFALTSRVSFYISRFFADDNIWLAVKNLKDQTEIIFELFSIKKIKNTIP